MTGGQVIMRYAILPKYNQTRKLLNTLQPPPDVRYVISDPSSYFYFDKNRPYQRNGLIDKQSPASLVLYNNPRQKIPYTNSFSFGYPNSSWNQWQVKIDMMIILLVP
jgi:hypothetical protein